MRYIKLTQGMRAKVDDEDYARLAAFSWQVQVGQYTNYAVRLSRGTQRTIYMHREIMGTPDGLYTDHKNRNGLDNRRSNLRNVDGTQNNLNRRIRKDNKSGTIGVSKHPTGGWHARVQCYGQVFSKLTRTKREAVAAVRAARYALKDSTRLK